MFGEVITLLAIELAAPLGVILFMVAFVALGELIEPRIEKRKELRK